MILFIMTDETTREELGEWLRACCAGFYGLTFNTQMNAMQVGFMDETDATTFRLAFADRTQDFGTI